MTRTERMTIALVAAIVIASLAMLPVTTDRGFLVLTGLLVIFSALLATLARRLGAGNLIATIVQVVPGVAVWFSYVGRDPWPLLDDVWMFALASRPPMEPHDGFRLVSSIGLWLLYLVCEILANALEQPAWTIPVLVTPYLVPALGMRDDVPIYYSVFPALAYLIVLLVDATERHRQSTGRPKWLVLTATGVVIGAVALAVPLAASPLIPVGKPWWNGTGNGPGTVIMNDPSLDLVRNLQETSRQSVLTYTTDAPGGVYLRLAALELADDDGFHLAATSLLPLRAWEPDGGTVNPAWPEHDIKIKVGDFASGWLPAPQQATAFDVPGTWSFDPATHNVLASGDVRDDATRNLAYSARFAVRPQDNALDLEGFVAGDPGDGGQTLAITDLVNEVRSTAEFVTQDAQDDGAKALALLNWFHSDLFTYNTSQAAGTTRETMENFVLYDHVGYCEQFAGGMALMARAVGIPARIAVGFLPGTKQADGTYLVQAQQMHAWTELYLTRDTTVDGRDVHEEGWYRFDPTPPAAVGLPVPPTTAPTSTPKATPSASPSAKPSQSATPQSPSAKPTQPTQAPDAGGDWSTLLTILAVAVVAVGLAFVPLAVRSVRRARRHLNAPEDAWDELRDCVRDAGDPWPSGTPRQVAQALSPAAGDQADGLQALAIAVERTRFARDTSDLDESVQLTQLTQMWTKRSKWWQRLWPRSVFRL